MNAFPEINLSTKCDNNKEVHKEIIHMLRSLSITALFCVATYNHSNICAKTMLHSWRRVDNLYFMS